MSFWVGVNTKNPSKSGGLFKKTPKNWTFHITWGSIQEWGCNIADTVIEIYRIFFSIRVASEFLRKIEDPQNWTFFGFLPTVYKWKFTYYDADYYILHSLVLTVCYKNNFFFSFFLLPGKPWSWSNIFFVCSLLLIYIFQFIVFSKQLLTNSNKISTFVFSWKK